MDGRAAAAISAQHRMQLRFRNFDLSGWRLRASVLQLLQLATALS